MEHMNETTVTGKKRGRRPRGAITMVNVKLLSPIALRLKLAATPKHTQRQIVEDLLDGALPPLPSDVTRMLS